MIIDCPFDGTKVVAATTRIPTIIVWFEIRESRVRWKLQGAPNLCIISWHQLLLN